jgi:hypothetical protein
VANAWSAACITDLIGYSPWLLHFIWVVVKRSGSLRYAWSFAPLVHSSGRLSYWFTRHIWSSDKLVHFVLMVFPKFGSLAKYGHH